MGANDVTTLAQQIMAIAAEQKLTSFAIHYYNHAGIPPYFYCYVHDNDIVGSGGQEGDTPAEAIARACADLNAKRFPQADLPELEAAWMASRPIETAPKDGTQILVPVGHGLFNVVSWWDDGWREGANGLRLANEPKQWFSLNSARAQVSA